MVARGLLPVAIASVLAVAADGARAERPAQSLVATPESTFAVSVRTLKQIRFAESFRTTVRQQYDFSCGSAAVATLLTYHYGAPVTEQAVFAAMFAAGDQAKIRTEGFSLLDMKRYLESRGYAADGYQITLDELASARIPAIALVRENNYNHFVVVKGIAGDRLVVGDPSAGTRILSRPEFEAMWAVKILFVIRSHLEATRFNLAADWGYRRRAPIGEVLLRESTATAQLMRPGASEF